MMLDAGATFTLLGHCERRIGHGETDPDVRAKAAAARCAGLSVILCVGETLADRETGKATTVVARQLAASLPPHAAGDWLSVAYEPIWAIGTGATPGADDVAAMHATLRDTLVALIGPAAHGVRLLYGGSVNAGNAATLFGATDVDGALVGRASLAASTLLPIIQAAAA